eukprot:4632895-Prymnesium_polylepis.1
MYARGARGRGWRRARGACGTRSHDVAGRLRVEGDVVGAHLGEVLDDPVDGRHHQVDVDGRGDAVVLEGLAHHRADRQVGHVVVVHHLRARRRRVGGRGARCGVGWRPASARGGGAR